MSPGRRAHYCSGKLTVICWRIHCIAIRTLDQLPQLSRTLVRHHIPARSKHASLLHFSQHTPQNPTFPIVVGHDEKQWIQFEWLNVDWSMWVTIAILTESPPDANDIFGMSCDVIISLFSKLISDNNLLDTRNVTFVPAFSISGFSASACWMRLSHRRFFNDFRPAASQTRFIHSFATCERSWKSNNFIDVFISRHPMYWNEKFRKTNAHFDYSNRFEWIHTKSYPNIECHPFICNNFVRMRPSATRFATKRFIFRAANCTVHITARHSHCKEMNCSGILVAFHPRDFRTV